MASRRNASPVRTRVQSEGVRKRLGRPVKDAPEALIMPLTAKDIARAAKKRAGYEVDEPDNFSECVLATCLSKVAGAEVLIMRKHAFVALPGDEFTLRYEVAPESTDLIHLNDEGRFDEIPANVLIKLRPPSPKRRLVAMRTAKKKTGAARKAVAGTGPRQRQSDPYLGVWRNGTRSAEA